MKSDSVNEEQIKEGAPFAALSYILFLWVFSFIWRKNNKFALYHAKQGLALFILEIAYWILSLVPFLGNIFRWFYPLSFLIFVGISFYGIYGALTAKFIKIPFITNFAQKLVL